MKKVTVTVPHASYREPSDFEIKVCFSQIGFKYAGDYDIVRNLANGASFYFVELDPQKCLVPLKVPTEPRALFEYMAMSSLQQFIASLDYGMFTGDTPIKKAACIMAALSSMIDITRYMINQLFKALNAATKADGEKLARDVMKKVEDFDREYNKPDGLFEAKPGIPKEVAMANLLPHQKELLEKLVVIDSMEKIQVIKNPDTYNRQLIQELPDVVGTSPFDAALPTFDFKFATKQLLVRKRNLGSKHTVIMLLDVSSSMCEAEKVSWVAAVLINRLRAIVNGDASALYLVPFEAGIDVRSTIAYTSPEQASDAIRRIIDVGNPHDPYAGCTDVHASVKSIIRCIEIGQIGVHVIKDKPQIIIVNDGQDSVPPLELNYKVHAIVLGTRNHGLRKMVECSGGHYQEFYLEDDEPEEDN